MKDAFMKIRQQLAAIRLSIVRMFLKRILKIGQSWDPTGNRINDIYCTLFNDQFDNIMNYRLRPKRAVNFSPMCIPTDTRPGQLAIVLQGLPETKDDFSLETVRFYKKIFPGAVIIISTWDSVEDSIIDSFRAEGCDIVINKTFSPCGYGNVNYQICTSFSGICRAKELGAEFVIKCRSDLRIYRLFSFEYLRSLQESLPVLDIGVPIKGRIITLPSGGGQLFNPLYLQDYFYFGYTEDLVKLFDIPYDDRSISSSAKYLKETYKPCTCAQMCDTNIPEIYIIKSFLSKYISVECTVQQMFDLLKALFIVVDFDDLNAYWGKYGVHSLSILDNTYYGSNSPDSDHQQICFETFISINNGHIRYEEWMEDVRYRNYIFR